MSRFVAVFEVRVGGENGVRVALDVVETLRSIDFADGEYPVRVVPVVVDHTEEDYIGPEGEPVEFLVPYLDILRAEVTIKSDATTLEKADISKFYGQPRRVATDALARTLAHLRYVTGDVSVNVTPHLWRAKEYLDESGAVVKHPIWVSFDIGMDGPPDELALPSWDRVATAVETGKRIHVGHEWLLDARAFREAHNYSMALASAAVACEVYGYQLLRRRLSEGDRATASMIDGFMEQVSRRDLFPTLFRYFEIGDPAMAKQITDVFIDRNDIIHGKRSKQRQVPEQQADTAISIAEFLESAVASERGRRG